MKGEGDVEELGDGRREKKRVCRNDMKESSIILREIKQTIRN